MAGANLIGNGAVGQRRQSPHPLADKGQTTSKCSIPFRRLREMMPASMEKKT